MNHIQRIGLAACHTLDALRAWLFARVVHEPVWRTADGRIMLVREMRDGHLTAAMHLLERAGDNPKKLAELRAERAKRRRFGGVP